MGRLFRYAGARAGYWAADFYEVDPHLGTEVRLDVL